MWWHHRLTAEALTRWAHHKTPRLLIFEPAQVGKSELVTRRLCPFMLGMYPDEKGIAASHSADLAEQMNTDVQRIMEQDTYHHLFPESRISERSGDGARKTKTYFELLGRRGSLRTPGVQKKIAGHPGDWAVIDDPFGGQEDAESPTIRESVWQWYTGDLLKRLHKDSPIVITHTRWHPDDLAGRLLMQMIEGSGEHWEVLCFQSLFDPNWKFNHPRDPRKEGEALWPAHQDEKSLAVQKELNPRRFAATDQQDPQAAGAFWDSRFFGPTIWFDEWPEFAAGSRALQLDSSQGDSGKLGDYSCLIKGQWHNNLLYVEADMENTRGPGEIVDTFISYLKTWRPHHAGVEKEFGGVYALSTIQDRVRAAHLWTNICTVETHNISKPARIRRLDEAIRHGRVKFKSGSRGTQILVEQLRQFPNGDHDDGPDCLEMLARLLAEAGVTG